MKTVLVASLLFFMSMQSVDAYVPNLITQETLSDITIIDDPVLSQAFYGSLQSFPHTYEIRSSVPFHLSTKILIPDIEASKNNISGIVIKLPEGRGRVTEVASLEAKNAKWESMYDPVGGDSYREGPSFEGELSAGSYRIEVHTPDNAEKYVLVVGTREDMSIGYFETLKRLLKVKEFFGKSPVRIVESPLVYIPLVIISVVGVGVWYVRQRRRSIEMVQ